MTDDDFEGAGPPPSRERDALTDAQACDAAFQRTAQAIEAMTFAMGRDLYFMAQYRVHVERGYRTFGDFIEDNYWIGKDRQQRLRRPYKVALQLGIPYERMIAVGSFNKVLAILPVLTQANADEWLDKAQRTRLDLLEVEVAQAKARLKGGSQDRVS